MAEASHKEKFTRKLSLQLLFWSSWRYLAHVLIKSQGSKYIGHVAQASEALTARTKNTAPKMIPLSKVYQETAHLLLAESHILLWEASLSRTASLPSTSQAPELGMMPKDLLEMQMLDKKVARLKTKCSIASAHCFSKFKNRNNIGFSLFPSYSQKASQGKYRRRRR